MTPRQHSQFFIYLALKLIQEIIVGMPDLLFKKSANIFCICESVVDHPYCWWTAGVNNVLTCRLQSMDLCVRLLPVVCSSVLCLQESYFHTAAYNSHYMYLLIYFACVQFYVHSLCTLIVHYLCILALQLLPLLFAINQFCFWSAINKPMSSACFYCSACVT